MNVVFDPDTFHVAAIQLQALFAAAQDVGPVLPGLQLSDATGAARHNHPLNVREAADVMSDGALAWFQHDDLRSVLALSPRTRGDAATALLALDASATMLLWLAGAIAEEEFTPGDYERLCQGLLMLIIGADVDTTPATGDGGIDLIHEVRLPEWSAAIRTYGQFKRYRGVVPVGEFREFLGVVHTDLAAGYFFTTSGLTADGEALRHRSHHAGHKNPCHLCDFAGHAAMGHALASFALAIIERAPLSETAFLVHLEALKAAVREGAHLSPKPSTPQLRLL